MKNFDTFKYLYGQREVGTRIVKIGNETLRVNNQEFSYDVVPEKEPHQEVIKRRLMQGTLSSQ